MYPSCLHTTWVHVQKNMHTVSSNKSYAIPFIVQYVHPFKYFAILFFRLLPHLSFPPSLLIYPSLSPSVPPSFLHSLSSSLPPSSLPPSLPPFLPYSGIKDVPRIIAHCTPHSIVLHFNTTTARGGASH